MGLAKKKQQQQLDTCWLVFLEQVGSSKHSPTLIQNNSKTRAIFGHNPQHMAKI